MKKVITTCVLVLLLCLFQQVFGATRFWIAGTSSNWNNIANWSNVSGGAGGLSVPVAADDVNFDNHGIGNCNLDMTVNVKSITVSALYTGTITQGTNPITTVQTASFSGGNFAGGNSDIIFGGAFTVSGTAFTSTSTALELRDNAAFTGGSFIHNNGTVRFNCVNNAAQAITGTGPVFYILEFVGISRTYTMSALVGDITVINSLNTSGSAFYRLTGGVIDVNGDINSTNTATGCGGDAQFNIVGAGTQNFNGSTVAGAGALTQLTINKPSGTLTLANFPGVSNNFIYTAGAISPGTSTFCFTHANNNNYNITGSLSLTNIEFFASGGTLTLAIAAATTLTGSGDLTIAGAGNVLLNTGNINISGNIFLTNTANGGGGSTTINIVGAGAESMDGTAVTVNQSRLPVININKPGGTLSLLGNISFSANLTYTAGTINAGTSTCYIVNNLTITGIFSIYNLTVLAAGNTTVTITAGSIITATNTLDLENGANFISINTGTIAVQGNIVDNNSATTASSSGTILIDGTGTQTITTSGVVDQGKFPAVTMNKVSGTLVFPTLMTVTGNWTYISGTLDPLTNNSTVVFEGNLTITGNHTLNNITFDGSNNFTFTTAVGTTLTVSGNMNMIGGSNITLATGTINLNGNLVLTNTGGGGGTTNLTFTGSTNQSIISALLVNQNCLPSVTINKPSGTLAFPSLITVKGSWTYSAGTLDVNTNNSTVVFASPLGAGVYGFTGSHTLNNVTFEGNNNNTASVNTGTILTVSGTLSTTGAFNVFINTPVAGATAIQAQGNISVNNTSVAGGGTGVILINGTGSQLFSGNSPASQGLMPNLTIQKTTGTLTLSGIISESRNWTYTSGTVDATTNAGTVVFGGNNLTITSAGMSFYNVTFATSTSTLSNSMSVINNLAITGLSVLAPGANTINLGGNWTNWGTLGFNEAGSTVNFNGPALQTITTTGGENFTNFTVNNSGTGIQMQNAVAVATSLTMTKGNIDLQTNTLTLGTSAALPGTLNYTSGTMINTGTFKRWFAKATIPAGGTAGLFPVGTVTDYRPIFVSVPVSPPTTGGTIALSYTDATTNTITSISDPPFTIVVRKDLNWAMTETGIIGGSYNLQIQGTNYGLIGAVTDLRLSLANSIVGTAGVNAGTTLNPQVNRVSLAATDLSNTFFLGSINAISSPLPVNLVSLTASPNGNRVDIKWETAIEIQNDYFTILRSTDAAHWQGIGTINGKGTSTGDSKYEYFDDRPYDGISYYRLQNTDFDGKTYLSPIRTVDFDGIISSITVYPNPASTNIIISSSGNGVMNIRMLNSSGRIVPVYQSGNGSNQILDVSFLPSGVYFIQIVQGGMKETQSVIIKR